MSHFSPHFNRNTLLSAWAHVVTSHPWKCLGIGVILAAIALGFTLTNLEFRSDRSELVDPSLDWQQAYASYKRQFPHWSDAVVVVERLNVEANPDADARFVRALEAQLNADPDFGSVSLTLDPAETPAGLILTEPTPRVRAVTDDLARASRALIPGSFADLISLAFAAGVSPRSETDRAGLASMLKTASAIARGEAAGPLLGIDALDAPQVMRTPSGAFAVSFVPLRAHETATHNPDQPTAINTDLDTIKSLRAHIRRVLVEENLQGAVRVGVTGVPVLEADETAQSMKDATFASAISVCLITLLLVWVYRGVVTPLLILVALLIGVAWSFGWVTLAVGHLQVLSVVFAIVLLGLGVDTAIHLVARLELVHPDHDHMAPAIAQAFRGVGPGVLTGALTTAAAFGATALTRFAGVAEMGLIAAGGVLLTTLAVMSLLPAMLMLLPKPQRRIRQRLGGEDRPFAGRFGRFIDGHPIKTLIACAAVLIVSSWQASRVQYDPDLQALMPAKAESVVWERKLAADDARSQWHATVIARDADDARVLTHKLRELDVASDVGGAGILFPDADDLRERKALLRAIPKVPMRGGAMPEQGSTALHAAALQAANTLAPTDPLHTSLLALEDAVSKTDAAGEAVERAFVRERGRITALADRLRSATLPHPGQLPKPLRRQVVGKNGSLLLRVYPRSVSDAHSSLSRDVLGGFVEAVREVAPGATGPAVQIYESSRVIWSAYQTAALLALGAIGVLLVIDLRNVGDVACALLPVASGAVVLLGIMGTFGIDLNFANTIVMPLIAGLGVDAGVHAVHRWRQQPGGAPAGLAGGSGRAITLTTLTTIIGFACMTLAEHRGIRSLGIVMSAGLTAVWLSTVFCLPAVLRLRTRFIFG